MVYKFESKFINQYDAILEFECAVTGLVNLHKRNIILKNIYKKSNFWSGDRWIFEYELEEGI